MTIPYKSAMHILERYWLFLFILCWYYLSTMKYVCILCVDGYTISVCDMTQTYDSLWLFAANVFHPLGQELLSLISLSYDTDVMPCLYIHWNRKEVILITLLSLAAVYVVVVVKSVFKIGNVNAFHDDVIKWKHFPRYWPFVWRIHQHQWIPCTKASEAELWYFLWSAPE